MKSPAQIQAQLSKQWQNRTHRIDRLLGNGLPLTLSIGRPSAPAVREQTQTVKAHLQQWHDFDTLHQSDSSIQITWATHHYQATASAITYPDTLVIHTPNAWQRVMAKGQSKQELTYYLALFETIFSGLFGTTFYPTVKAYSDPTLHAQLSLLLSQRKLVTALPPDTLLQILLVANLITPACANGLPLRSLDISTLVHALHTCMNGKPTPFTVTDDTQKVTDTKGATHPAFLQKWLDLVQSRPDLGRLDSKFFATHTALLTRLLNVRFAGEVSQQGLETFIHASKSGKHWLLVFDTGYFDNSNLNNQDVDDKGDDDGDNKGDNNEVKNWLPVSSMRISDTDLTARLIRTLPHRNILIIENETCLHLLPDDLTDTLVILGAGRNLAWLANPEWAKKRLWYWGDIDTWGLAILSDARTHQPSIQPVMMDNATFKHHAQAIVTEPTPYPNLPANLTVEERQLFDVLQRGELASSQRLEQEFISADWVANALTPLLNKPQKS